jgi:adenylate cyclase
LAIRKRNRQANITNRFNLKRQAQTSRWCCLDSSVYQLIEASTGGHLWSLSWSRLSTGRRSLHSGTSKRCGFAERAARLGHDDAFVLARSAHVLAYLGRKYDRAELLAEQAVTLNTNCAPAWHSRGWVAAVGVLPDRALESFQQMMRLSPLDPLTVGALYGSAFAYFLASRYEEGLAAATRAIQMAANVLSLAAFIVNAISLGRSAEATGAAAHLLKIDPTFRVGQVDHVFPARSADARSRIEWALRESGLPE